MSGVVRRRAPLAFADRRLQMARQLIVAALDELSGAVPAGGAVSRSALGWVGLAAAVAEGLGT